MVKSIQDPNSLCGHDSTQFVELDDDHHPTTFPCGACWASIAGKRFSCKICCLNLHPICKACPATLSLPTLHPQHPVALLPAPPQGGPTALFCDVCLNPIKGAFYSCNSNLCEFDVHPLCSQLPPQVGPGVHDPTHPLELQYDAPGKSLCDVCRTGCGGWAYRCAKCSVDVHYWCLQAPPPAMPTTTTRSVVGPGGAVPGYPPYMPTGYGVPLVNGPYGYGYCPYGGGMVNPAGESSRGQPTVSKRSIALSVLGHVADGLMDHLSNYF